ncbi:MAG: DUF2784 domain-containing protein [Gemmatimonadaceae bacterium]
MAYRWAADAIVVVHLAFVAFVVLGGLLVLRWPRVVWAHLPAAAWGAFVEFSGVICPLTPWEVALRQRGREAGYAGGFVQHYLIPTLYPSGLTPHIQYALGTFVLALNAAIYWRVMHARPSTE